MMKKKKVLIDFINKIDEQLPSIEENEKRYIIMKIALLKWLIDHEYIHWDRGTSQRLFQDFTFENILYCWDRKRIHIMEEYHHPFDAETWDGIGRIIFENIIFKEEPSVVLGEIYELSCQVSKRKKEGMFYTPFFVIEFMIEGQIENWQLTDKVIDPACGCGFFISVAYDKLMEYYLRNPILLGTNKKHIHEFIIENQLYGIEKNEVAAGVSKLVLLLKQPYLTIKKTNILCEDTLLGDLKSLKDKSFRLVMGNPPYVGHKKIDREYGAILKEKYKKVFHDKGDLSYCFFQKGWELLTEGGTLCFITSRYFLEALHGENLRNFLVENYQIHTIVDFYGQRILKGIQVDPLIIILEKSIKSHKQKYIANIYKLKECNKNTSGKMILEHMGKEKSTSFVDYFSISQGQLKKEGWRLLHPMARNIIHKIEIKSPYQLEDVCESKQGVITGRDKAFVMTKAMAMEKGLSGKLLRPWIKGKQVMPFQVMESEKVLLFANDILDIDRWPAEKRHLITYKKQLEMRRECIKGIRPWYHLQWGRDKDFFEKEKIIYPYKASSNRFALDHKGNYYSADIYGIRVKENDENYLSNEALTLILNTNIYEFYFKGFAKKLGKNMYEYYPNTIMQLAIPRWSEEEHSKLVSEYTLLMHYLKKENKIEMKNVKERVENWLMSYFQFTQEEKEFIKTNIL